MLTTIIEIIAQSPIWSNTESILSFNNPSLNSFYTTNKIHTSPTINITSRIQNYNSYGLKEYINTLTFAIPIKNTRTNIGGTALTNYTNIGNYSYNLINVNYSYRIPLNKPQNKNIYFGFGLGAKNISLNTDRFIYEDQINSAGQIFANSQEQNGLQNISKFDALLGFAFVSTKSIISFSYQNIPNNEFYPNPNYENKSKQLFFISRKIHFSNASIIQPGLFIENSNYRKQILTSLEFHQKKLKFGANYRTITYNGKKSQSSLIFSIGHEFERFKIQYSIEKFNKFDIIGNEFAINVKLNEIKLKNPINKINFQELNYYLF